MAILLFLILLFKTTPQWESYKVHFSVDPLHKNGSVPGACTVDTSGSVIHPQGFQVMILGAFNDTHYSLSSPSYRRIMPLTGDCIIETGLKQTHQAKHPPKHLHQEDKNTQHTVSYLRAEIK